MSTPIGLYKNKDWVYKKYVIERLYAREIAELCKINEATLRYWMDKFNLKRRDRSETQLEKSRRRHTIYNKEWLYQKYWNEELSCIKIAKLCKTTKQTIRNWMKKFNIPRRTLSEAQKGEKHSNWGKKCPKETIEKIRKSNIGKKRSGQTRKNISKALKNQFGEKARNWKGGRLLANGYILIYKPEHPNAGKFKYIFEHRLIMEKYLGRYLKGYELVHHMDGDKKNNNISNLRLENRKTHPIGYVAGYKEGFTRALIIFLSANRLK